VLILIDPLEIAAEMVMRAINFRAKQALHAVPGCHDLSQGTLVRNPPVPVDGDTLRNFDAEVPGPGAGRFQCLEQLRVASDADSPATRLRAPATLKRSTTPADLTKKRGGKHPRHQTADNDGAPFHMPPRRYFSDKFVGVGAPRS